MQLKIYAGDGSLEDVRNFTDVPAENGVATAELGRLERERLIEADVLVQPRGTGPTHVLRGRREPGCGPTSWLRPSTRRPRR